MSCGCFGTPTRKWEVDKQSKPFVYKSDKQYKQELKKRIMNKPEAYEIYG